MENTTNNSNENSLQAKIMKQIHDLGDSLERAGEKIEKNGWQTIGQAIYRLGDSLEHLMDKKSDSKSSDEKPLGASKTDSFSTGASYSGSSSASNTSSSSSGSKGFTSSKTSSDKSSGTDKGSRAY